MNLMNQMWVINTHLSCVQKSAKPIYFSEQFGLLSMMVEGVVIFVSTYNAIFKFILSSSSVGRSGTQYFKMYRQYIVGCSPPNTNNPFQIKVKSILKAL